MGRHKIEPRPVTTADLVARRDLHPVAEAAYRLGLNKSTLYRLANADRLQLVKVGGRTYVTDNELRRFVAGLEAAAS